MSQKINISGMVCSSPVVAILKTFVKFSLGKHLTEYLWFYFHREPPDINNKKKMFQATLLRLVPLWILWKHSTRMNMKYFWLPEPWKVYALFLYVMVSHQSFQRHWRMIMPLLPGILQYVFCQREHVSQYINYNITS